MKTAKIKKVKKSKEWKQMEPDLETRVLRLENVSRINEALSYKIQKLESQMDNLKNLFETMLKMSNPVAQPRQPRYRSGEWHRRSGNVYQDVALPGSPNAEEAETAALAGKTPDDQRGDLPPSEQR